MLQVYAGRSGSGKTERVYQEIRDRAHQKNVILLVPEQSSFQSEQRILSMLGAAGAADVKVLSFRRLYDAVTEQYGGAGAKRIDDGVKAVLMSLAAEAVSEQLVLYSTRSKRSDFAQLMLSAINEYKMCAITPEQLLRAADKTDDTRLQQKLRESAAVYAAYQSLLGSAYADPDDDMTRLYELLWDHPFFEGACVFLDSFNGFSGQELKIVERILAQADFVGVTLCCDHAASEQLDSTIFKEPDTTLRQLKRLAEMLSVEMLPTIWLDAPRRFRNPSLAAVEESVFRFDGDPYGFDDHAVNLYEADDEYDEINQTARDISRLVMQEGYEYRQITVVCREPERYRNIIASEFPKYRIPYFMSDPQPLEDKPLIRLVLSAFEIVHSSFSTENILSFLKTGLTPLSDNEVFRLENYVYLWDIKGSRWKQPFTMNPDGNTDQLNEEKLAALETMRQTIMAPLIAFLKALTDAGNGGEISEAVYRLLQQLDVPQTMKKLIGSYDHYMEPKQRETEARIWDVVMDILDKLHTVLKNTYVTGRRYEELLRLMLSKNPISDIPQTLDQVIVGVAGNLRSEGQRAVFLIGAVDGVFPAVPVASGLFSDSERLSLINLELPLYDSLFGMMLKEKFNAYAALSLPSEKLFVSRYLSNTKGDTCEPSVIFKELRAMFPEVPVRHHTDDPVEDYFFTEQQAFEECAARFHRQDSLSAGLRAYFSQSEQYAEAYRALRTAVREEPYRLSDREHAKKLFGEKLTLSASQAETFFQCPFHYFCRYGLKAYPRKRASMDAGMYGSAVHAILERLLHEVGYQKLVTLEDKDLLSLIHAYLEGYIQELGGEQDRTQRFLAQFELIEKNLTLLLKRLFEEFSVTSFIPADYELTIGEEGEIPSYELSLPTGETLSLVGKVDRVDTYIHEGKKYIRIVDYKTGVKKFRLSDVLYGLNLQMLLYLAAIDKNGSAHYSEEQYPLAPAGILYMPSTPLSETGGLHTQEVKDELLKKQKAAFKMSGLLIDDIDILKAMEKDARGLFIPAKLTADHQLEARTKSVVSLEAYGKIFSFIDRKLLEMASSLYDGRIERRPAKGAADACQFCDYKHVCGYEDGKRARPVTNLGLEKALEQIMKALDETNGKEEAADE